MLGMSAADHSLTPLKIFQLKNIQAWPLPRYFTLSGSLLARNCHADVVQVSMNEQIESSNRGRVPEQFVNA